MAKGPQTLVIQDKDRYLSAFEDLEKGVRQEPDWMDSLRKNAFSRFFDLGFPTVRNEEWKYTNVEPIARTPFRFVFEPTAGGLNARDLEPFLFRNEKWSRLVFVDGFYSRELSLLSRLPAGVIAGNLREAMVKHSALIQPYLARLIPFDKNGFIALNTAFIHDGAFVFLPEGTVLQEPLHLLFISTSREGKNISQPRNLLVGGKKTKAVVIESYVSLGEDVHFTNGVTEIVLNEGARMDHYKIQRESRNAFHIGTTQVELAQKSFYASASITLGGALARNTLSVRLGAEGAGCVLNGLYLADGNQHIDNTTFIDHLKPGGTSHQLYKGILAGQSTGVFAGKIFVRKDAQKTDAHQTNKNLLLSDQAHADTKPQLEIAADDVKCTHGAAVGQLDENAIFYLKSRGIPQEKARNLLTYGFASEMIHLIQLEPVREELDSLVLERLKAGELK